MNETVAPTTSDSTPRSPVIVKLRNPTSSEIIVTKKLSIEELGEGIDKARQQIFEEYRKSKPGTNHIGLKFVNYREFEHIFSPGNNTTEFEAKIEEVKGGFVYRTHDPSKPTCVTFNAGPGELVGTTGYHWNLVVPTFNIEWLKALESLAGDQTPGPSSGLIHTDLLYEALCTFIQNIPAARFEFKVTEQEGYLGQMQDIQTILYCHDTESGKRIGDMLCTITVPHSTYLEVANRIYKESIAIGILADHFLGEITDTDDRKKPNPILCNLIKIMLGLVPPTDIY